MAQSVFFRSVVACILFSFSGFVAAHQDGIADARVDMLLNEVMTLKTKVYELEQRIEGLDESELELIQASDSAPDPATVARGVCVTMDLLEGLTPLGGCEPVVAKKERCLAKSEAPMEVIDPICESYLLYQQRYTSQDPVDVKNVAVIERCVNRYLAGAELNPPGLAGRDECEPAFRLMNVATKYWDDL